MATRRNDDDDLLSPRGARNLRDSGITADDDWEKPSHIAKAAGIPKIDGLDTADRYTVKGADADGFLISESPGPDLYAADGADHQPKLDGLDEFVPTGEEGELWLRDHAAPDDAGFMDYNYDDGHID